MGTSKNPINSVTILGLISILIGFAGQFFPQIPVEEIEGLLDWVKVNWDVLAQGIGLVVAIIGRARQGDLDPAAPITRKGFAVTRR
ncbi:MAG: hypothetical protein AAF236_02195 [Verrucomicrobiota bacterium]